MRCKQEVLYKPKPKEDWIIKPMKSMEDKPLVAMVIRRLCTTLPDGVKLSELEDELLLLASTVAIEWQKLRSWRDWWELHGATKGIDENRMHFLAGRMAAAGEQLGLSYTACMEVEIWKRKIADAPTKPEEAMAIRALAELGIHFVLGAGHALANCLIQALSLNADLRGRLEAKLNGSFVPFSTNRNGWVSLNKATLRKCRSAVGGQHDDVVSLVGLVDKMVKDVRWVRAVRQRDEDFHRWRSPSPGITEAGRDPVWKHEGTTRTFGVGGREYRQSNEVALETARLAKEALGLAATTFHSYLEEGWPKATRALGVPLFKDESEDQ